MSEIKQSAKILKELSKKYGYNIKHTHALELVSQILEQTNRHVALKKEESKISKNLSYKFKLEDLPYSINLPFFQAYVIEFNLEDDCVDFAVVQSLSEFIFLIGERGYSLDYFKVLTPKELENKVRYSKEDSDEDAPEKPIMDWITEKYQETKETSFTVFNDY